MALNSVNDVSVHQHQRHRELTRCVDFVPTSFPQCGKPLNFSQLAGRLCLTRWRS